MSLIILKNTSTIHPKQGISANVLTVKINNKTTIELPQICASRTDYDKSKKAKIPLNADIFQYYINRKLSMYNDVTDLNTQDKIVHDYELIMKEHSPIVSDVNFWYGDIKWTQKERDAALQLQTKMNTDFLSDVVMDRNQSYADFEITLNELIKYNCAKIKCPSVSMYDNSVNLEKKLNLIYEKKFKRFNIEWAGLTYRDNWNVLSSFLHDKEIWCNMVSVNHRRHKTTKKSYPMFGIAYGAGTVGLGYFRRYGNNSSTGYDFDPITLTDKFVQGEPYILDSISHNKLHKIIYNSHKHIKKNTFYGKIIPSNFT